MHLLEKSKFNIVIQKSLEQTSEGFWCSSDNDVQLMSIVCPLMSTYAIRFYAI